MPAASDVIDWKYANAFVPDAEMSAGAKRAFIFGGSGAIEWMRQRIGGLWVGGAVTLTNDALYFAPNALNAAAHDGDTSQAVPLHSVVAVQDRFGWLTRIIDVRADDGSTLTFRCFGARAFADKIRAAVADAQAASSA